MARDHARINLSIWHDEEFINLSLAAKLLYLQLVSQPRLSYAGVLDLAAKRWARPHPDLSLTEIRAALSELDAARFVVIDQETEELLVRSFIRNDELFKQPNVLRGALRVAFDIESPILRAALATELRRLPVDITGPAPSATADALEAGAREMPPEVKAALSVRGSARTSSARPKAAPAKGSAKPSPTGPGEGSRERETGETSLPLRSKKVGSPARAARDASSPERAQGETGHDPDRSERQLRREEAERLVDFYAESLPARVRAQLVAEVIPLLREGISSAVVGSGLAAWSSKTLPVSFLAMLVGERMRAARVAGTDTKKRARDAEMVERFEGLRASAIAEDEQHGVGLAVRQARPQHADAEQLTAILDNALTSTASELAA
ncbi:hypothetical protein G3I59_36820 [Amycolatopsis rubida]|uniref:DUF4373 domain-containing protein n=1 Tax=Amycolatopsis rubida TaxID=112413 RepID=A0ABX0C115_9PSEU|nr:MULTISPECIES: hypothetical protein [Amycolatopsis]MYW96023.1 hypothetical protein [Amycolatopsis rubida]NEC61014.1 hypothetical protein [Amycolatopsis rubida]OAP20548.1 hypothetical protein A4R44_08708 [Amycolatopsis sp. M39]